LAFDATEPFERGCLAVFRHPRYIPP
jgi:hypothetical protein